MQHVHRYAGILQTIEYGFDICTVYLERYKEFPACGNVTELFSERCQGIFNEIFSDQVDTDDSGHVFFINDQVVGRAIDLVSGLLNQLKILMDDSCAPIWNGTQTRPVVISSFNSEQNMTVDKSKKKKLGKESCLLNISVFLLFYS